jgi:hypothetical protein
MKQWLKAVEQALSKGFSGLEDLAALPPAPRADSPFWSRTLLAPGMGPHEPAVRARRAVHPATESTPDLLLHEYEAAGLPLRVIEGRSFVLVEVGRAGLDVLALPAEEREAAIRGAAARLIAGGGELSFRLPERAEEGAFFSTNPETEAHAIGTWQERVDGGIRDGALFFLIPKKLPFLVGFLDGRQWFAEGRIPGTRPGWTGRRRRARRRR